jgi:diguanylate cyclase (GGDEF)-like protein/PAS domain S-box-containing protein
LVATVLAGVVLTLALLAAGRRIDSDRDTVRDGAALAAATAALRAQLDTLGGQVQDVAGLFEASRSVMPSEYADFAAPMLKRSGATALTFLQDVPGSQLEAFERVNGPVRELAADGSTRPAARRDRYVVVTRTAYEGTGAPLLNVDVLSQPGREPAIDQAERTGAVAATDLVHLARDRRGGLIVYAPVRGRLSGVVAGSFSRAVLQDAVTRALGHDARVRVAATNGLLVSAGPPPGRRAPRRGVAFGGRTYTVTAEAAPEDGLRIGLLAPLAGIVATLVAVLAQSGWRARRRVAVGEARFAAAFEASPVGQALSSPDGRLARVNDALCSITGHDCETLPGRSALDLVHPTDRERAQDLLDTALEQPGVAAGSEVRLLTAAGGTRWAQLHFTRLADRGAPHPLLTQVIDVSDRRGLEVELRHQAEHDALTELLNRRGFQRRLGGFLAQGVPGALMLIDLDHFKAVNDTLGHHVGDQVIHAAGQALRGSVRADDIVGRLGGDEFAVLLPGADRERARATAERLVQAISTQGVPAAHGVTASVGVAMVSGAFASADEALMAADLAMYDAKEAGRRRAAFFDSDGSSGTHSRLQWVDRIRTALAEERFVLLAQPIADLATGELAHHELLLRMLDEDGEQVKPDQFLPIAEQFGLMAEIDRWVATTAIGQLARHAHRDLVFEVNLSGSSLGSPELLEAIREALVQGGVAPGRLIFEITETEAVTNLDEAHAFALQLAALGCRFALDDFGVGFGSFTYVKHLPFDFLKIDGEFVRHSAISEPDRVILESLIHAARGLGKRTIAEYVENEETEALLRELGVDLVQGYRIGPPRPLAQVIAGARLTSSSRVPEAPSAGS